MTLWNGLSSGMKNLQAKIEETQSKFDATFNTGPNPEDEFPISHRSPIDDPEDRALNKLYQQQYGPNSNSSKLNSLSNLNQNGNINSMQTLDQQINSVNAANNIVSSTSTGPIALPIIHEAPLTTSMAPPVIQQQNSNSQSLGPINIAPVAQQVQANSSNSKVPTTVEQTSVTAATQQSTTTILPVQPPATTVSNIYQEVTSSTPISTSVTLGQQPPIWSESQSQSVTSVTVVGPSTTNTVVDLDPSPIGVNNTAESGTKIASTSPNSGVGSIVASPSGSKNSRKTQTQSQQKDNHKDTSPKEQQQKVNNVTPLFSDNPTASTSVAGPVGPIGGPITTVQESTTTTTVTAAPPPPPPPPPPVPVTNTVPVSTPAPNQILSAPPVQTVNNMMSSVPVPSTDITELGSGSTVGGAGSIDLGQSLAEALEKVKSQEQRIIQLQHQNQLFQSQLQQTNQLHSELKEKYRDTTQKLQQSQQQVIAAANQSRKQGEEAALLNPAVEEKLRIANNEKDSLQQQLEAVRVQSETERQENQTQVRDDDNYIFSFKWS